MITALLILALVLTAAATVGSVCWLAGQGFWAWLFLFDPMMKGFSAILTAIISLLSSD